MILLLPFKRAEHPALQTGLTDRQELGECGQEPELGKTASDTSHFLTTFSAEAHHQLGTLRIPGLAWGVVATEGSGVMPADVLPNMSILNFLTCLLCM